MSLCSDCKKEQLTSDGCTSEYIRIDGVRHRRMAGEYIKDSLYKETFETGKEKVRCDDCGSLTGFIHHFGCSHELCPIHKSPLVDCDCDGASPEV